jgi:hypothetical protein
VIGIDRIVRVPLDVMPRLWDELVEDGGSDGDGVGGHLGRSDLQRGQRPARESPGHAVQYRHDLVDGYLAGTGLSPRAPVKP